MKIQKSSVVLILITILMFTTVVVSADSHGNASSINLNFIQFIEDFNEKQLSNSELETYKNNFNKLEYENRNLYVKYIDSMIQFSNGDFDKGFKNLEKLLTDIDRKENPTLYTESLLKIQEVSWHFWDLNKILDSGIELKEWSEESDRVIPLIRANNALADVYYYFYDTENAMKLLGEALELAIEVDDNVGIAAYYFFIGDMHFYSDEYDQALINYKKAIEYAKKDNTYYITTSLRNNISGKIAETLALQGIYDEAYEVINNLIISTPPDRSHELMVFYNKLGIVQKESGNINEAIEAYIKALEFHSLTKEIAGAEPYSLSIEWDLADAYFINEEYEEAAKLYMSINESYGNNENLEETASKLGGFEADSYEKQMSLAEQLLLSKNQAYMMQKKNLLISNLAVMLLIAVIVLVLIDVRIKMKSRNELFIQSITDHLTNVLNRGRIIEVFEKKMNNDSAVILMDIDDFKEINDSHGHIVGDHVLKRIAKVTKESIREQDHVGRYGGEEFLVVLDKCDIETAKEIAERIRYNIESIEWLYDNLKTTASIGVALSKGASSDTILHDVDMNMYEAKKAGKNCVVIGVSD